jgi:hypothetical protein
MSGAAPITRAEHSLARHCGSAVRHVGSSSTSPAGPAWPPPNAVGDVPRGWIGSTTVLEPIQLLRWLSKPTDCDAERDGDDHEVHGDIARLM